MSETELIFYLMPPTQLLFIQCCTFSLIILSFTQFIYNIKKNIPCLQGQQPSPVYLLNIPEGISIFPQCLHLSTTAHHFLLEVFHSPVVLKFQHASEALKYKLLGSLLQTSDSVFSRIVLRYCIPSQVRVALMHLCWGSL